MTRINGNFVCQGNSSGTVAFESVCNANNGSVAGNVQVDDNSVGEFEITSVGGNMQVNDNGSPTRVYSNMVDGNFVCQGNASLTGSGHTVRAATHVSP
jgi:hypothetical protein